MKIKRKAMLITVSLCLIFVTGAVLLGIYLGTRGRTVNDYIEMPYAELNAELGIVEKSEDYLAHPDMVMTNSGRLIAAYLASHGHGSIYLKTSDDYGITWSKRVSNTPSSWAESQETPTLYKLNFVDGKSKIILIFL